MPYYFLKTTNFLSILPSEFKACVTNLSDALESREEFSHDFEKKVQSYTLEHLIQSNNFLESFQ